MKKFIILLAFFSFLNFGFAQEDSLSYSKVYLKPAAGFNIPLKNFFSGSITDDLLGFDDNTIYGQFFSLNYFFTSQWGVDLTYRGCHSANISDRKKRFKNQIETIYSDDFFVSPDSYSNYNLNNRASSMYEQSLLGLVYRFEKSKFLILPRIAAGLTSIRADGNQVELKEMGSNTVYSLSHFRDNSLYEFFTMAASTTFGYRLSNTLLANIDVQYAIYKTDIQYTEELKNIFTEETNLKTYEYMENIQTLSFGLGIIIDLSRISKNLGN